MIALQLKTAEYRNTPSRLPFKSFFFHFFLRFAANWIVIRKGTARAYFMNLLNFKQINWPFDRWHMLIEMMLMPNRGLPVVLNFHSKDNFNWKLRSDSTTEAPQSTLINQPNGNGLLSTCPIESLCKIYCLNPPISLWTSQLSGHTL